MAKPRDFRALSQNYLDWFHRVEQAEKKLSEIHSQLASAKEHLQEARNEMGIFEGPGPLNIELNGGRFMRVEKKYHFGQEQPSQCIITLEKFI